MANIKQESVFITVSPQDISVGHPVLQISYDNPLTVNKEVFLIAQASVTGLTISKDSFVLVSASQSAEIIPEEIKYDTVRHIDKNDVKFAESSRNIEMEIDIRNDTESSKTVNCTKLYDSLRLIIKDNFAKAESYRLTLNCIIISADSVRNTTSYNIKSVIDRFDINKNVISDRNISCVSVRELKNKAEQEAALLRCINKYENVFSSILKSTLLNVLNKINAERNIIKSIYFNAETSRNTMVRDLPVFLEADCVLSITANKDISADVLRVRSNSSEILADILRHVIVDREIMNSTMRKLPYDTSFHKAEPVHLPANRPALGDNPWQVFASAKAKPGPVSITITLGELTLSDSFELQTVQPIDVHEMITGRITDFEYCYQVGDISYTDLLRTAGGMYDTDILLYMPIEYSVYSSVKVVFVNLSSGSSSSSSGGAADSPKYYLSTHAARIGNALGKRVVFLCDNFKHKSTWTGNGNTYQSIISTLFGWSSVIPHMQINVFLRHKSNTLYIVQRGRELSKINITSCHHSRPEYKREIVRTLWATGKNEGRSEKRKGGNGIGASETITVNAPDNGDNTASYSEFKGANGGSQTLLTKETTDETVTTYSYTGGPDDGGYRLSKKETINTKDGSKNVTSYVYAIVNSGYMLVVESEIHYDRTNHKVYCRETFHHSLGNGGVLTQVFENKKLISSSLSESTTVSSPYRAQQETYDLTGSTGPKEENENEDDGSLGSGATISFGSSSYDSSIDYNQFPTDDVYFLRKYTNAIKWLNRKIKETVVMDIYDYGHVIDFTERVIFNGAEYYLSSNKITQTTNELKQNVTLVRWY